jgi:tetratricopeptide (TPR) repeat protein
MSMTLNLVDRLLSRARRLRSLGRTHDALSLFERLAAFGELPGPVAEATQVHLAELQLRRRRFRQARRHLAAALQHRPESARYHHLMARAVAGGPNADSGRALEHYRRSLAIAPDRPRCLCACGRLALHLGRRDEALTCLRRAAELAPDDPAVIGRAADGLRRANQTDEARALLRAARFRNPRDLRFRQLWDVAQFQELRQEQELARLGNGQVEEDGPVLLPFLRLTDGDLPAAAGRQVVRHDPPAPLPPPHGVGSTRLPPQRHAQ